MVSSENPSPHVEPITSMRGYVDAVTDLRDLVPAESQDRMYDLLTQIVDYTDRKAREAAKRESADKLDRIGHTAAAWILRDDAKGGAE